MSDKVVTRFAPSPTGYLHIGGARTALFNWLYAKHTGGTMLLRIEDTDRERSTEAATAAILDGLTWLGLSWDGEAVSQFERAPRHREVAEELVRLGKAYYAYETPAELDAMREAARAKGLPPRYNGQWRDRNPSEAPAGVRGAIRIKAPTEGETVVQDRVQGEVRFPNKDLDDFIILRSDGNPTYMHAVVVDDHDMGVTHIIRGDDHLTNAARQTVIYNAMGWAVPSMSHIPLIHGADGAKLSKRHGALGVEAYRAMGYLPEALLNYLARLGWSHGDDEVMSIADMVAWFDIGDVNKGAARFDFAKLEALNGVHMRKMDDHALFDIFVATLPYLEGGPALAAKLDDRRKAQLLAAMPGLKERAKTLVELVDGAAFLFAERPLPLDEKAAGLLSADARAILRGAHGALSSVQGEWNAASAEASIREFAQAGGHKLGAVAQPLRAALTGRSTSPGVFDVLAVLGRQESLARIGDQID
ncbi:glutamate--tRNA ligase [Mesorhizobium sp. M2D.F.Ca.ET.185.01.1.1]|uniref:glutamate--tRNA ligase n=1 Tax=unclassified Mesorhizobium TaxID=325217 RepID=UPI000FCBCB1D|nr:MULTISPECIES: glutamate--tRNA ligase [unclassified Mesorhizobium]TGP80947.1 glutamate--tRNA ligase [bacterium M00.F.Ca.ET.227.01.1.1]TGP90730.1 glutamate--tRNA ligase [bacterium M00.F.Ca.ET.221.01.1.1]TGP97409.1 glutamate--tRNA ligase [bacterium M00.F.Ca.ET.222.01.1.1]TGT75941.1 glutamate--tRNA ligase [bacterium M00.F.Ca.ET.159.01.1.1]TGT85002.1 glutamate--tRNA ligase [bacterium M00.F.Ca.ET.157.01.1.1]TGU07911.1 glutamate--tRNA ligase [bacterium M00.F.Ca.ET.163.01.1.1]TGU17934.1 glutamate